MSKNSERVKRWCKRHPEAAKVAAKRRDMRIVRDAGRRLRAREGGFLPPPPEKDCPPRPADGCCQGCGAVAKLELDHNHDTGAFRGWICRSCNTSPERRSVVGQFSRELASEARRLNPRPYSAVGQFCHELAFEARRLAFAALRKAKLKLK